MGEQLFLPRSQLGRMINVLHEQGYQVIGPTRRGEIVDLAPIESADDLPQGWRDEQDAGRYRLTRGDPELSFEYVVGPSGAKRQFFPPVQRLFQMHIEGEQFISDAGTNQPPRLALIGVRPCDLAAIRVQDRVFGAGDPTPFRCESEVYYVETRRNALLIAINCTRPGGTCFCDSMGTGPEARDGFDLAMTELRAGFLVRAGSQRGRELLDLLETREPTSAEVELAELKLDQARRRMGREMDYDGVPQLLEQAVEHPHWDEIAKRCLSCGNCTMVCPTCFCSTVVDSTDIADGSITRTRLWESCYTHEFSYTTAGPVRNTIRGRYRHWLRHKLSTWYGQFGTSGCVGCGRCITWCPVGIDLTEEIPVFRGQTAQDAVQSGQEVVAS